METKEIKYHDIKTRLYRDVYKHGEIIYLDKTRGECGRCFFKTTVNIKLALEENDVKNFENELTELIQKYAK